MSFGTDLRDDVIGIFNDYGEVLRLKYYVESYSGADYDDAFLTKSGADIYISGLRFPVTSSTGGEDFKLLTQGQIQFDDSKLYIAGSLATDLDRYTKIGVGSPNFVNYSIIDNGNLVYSVGPDDVYYKCFIRVLNAGSFIGEV